MDNDDNVRDRDMYRYRCVQNFSHGRVRERRWFSLAGESGAGAQPIGVFSVTLGTGTLKRLNSSLSHHRIPILGIQSLTLYYLSILFSLPISSVNDFEYFTEKTCCNHLKKFLQWKN